MRTQLCTTAGGATLAIQGNDEQLFFDELPREKQIEFLYDKFPMLDGSKTVEEVKELRTAWPSLKRTKWPHVIAFQFEVNLLPFSSEKIQAAIKMLSGYPTEERIKEAVTDLLAIDEKYRKEYQENIKKRGEIKVKRTLEDGNLWKE